MLREDPGLAPLAGKGYRVYWDGEGSARKLVVEDPEGKRASRPLPKWRVVPVEDCEVARVVQPTSDDILKTILWLVRYLKAGGS